MGVWNRNNPFLTTIRMKPTYLIHSKLQCNVMWLLTKQVPFRIPHQKFSQKVFPKLTGYMTEPIRIMILATHVMRIWSITTLIGSTIEAQKMICIIARSQSAITIRETDIFVSQENFPVYPIMLYGISPETTPRNFRTSFRKKTDRTLRMHSFFRIISGTKRTFYSISSTISRLDLYFTSD